MHELQPQTNSETMRTTNPWERILSHFEIPYRRRSSGVLLRLCLFHTERTASMFFRPSGKYSCYGCGAEGNIKTFTHKAANIPPFLVNTYLQLIPHDIVEYKSVKRREERITFYPNSFSNGQYVRITEQDGLYSSLVVNFDIFDFIGWNLSRLERERKQTARKNYY